MSAETEIKEIAHAFEQLSELPPILIQINPDTGFFLLAQLQLALRHPGNTGNGAQTIRQFAIGLQERLTELCPEVGDVLEKGWHPEFDQKVSTGGFDRNNESISLNITSTKPALTRQARYQDLMPEIQEEILMTSFALDMAISIKAAKLLFKALVKELCFPLE